MENEMCSYNKKKESLKKKIENYAAQDIMVAFSGGADSSLLLKLACEAADQTGRKVYAATMQTRLHPVTEIEAAKKVAEEIGAGHIIIPVDELKEAGILNNPPDRCYLCKKHLFLKMLEAAETLGISVILEGTNEDDLHVYRPGLKALRELRIISPLAEAGMTKAEVRRFASEYGLSVAGKPAMPCLATRFPYGTVLDYEKMEQVEKGEAYLRALGFQNVRLRIHGDIARIEVDSAALYDALAQKKEITEYLKNLGYVYIALDLEGFRSGSMDVFANMK